jgi:hypothetical protein
VQSAHAGHAKPASGASQGIAVQSPSSPHCWPLAHGDEWQSGWQVDIDCGAPVHAQPGSGPQTIPSGQGASGPQKKSGCEHAPHGPGSSMRRQTASGQQSARVWHGVAAHVDRHSLHPFPGSTHTALEPQSASLVHVAVHGSHEPQPLSSPTQARPWLHSSSSQVAHGSHVMQIGPARHVSPCGQSLSLSQLDVHATTQLRHPPSASQRAPNAQSVSDWHSEGQGGVHWPQPGWISTHRWPRGQSSLLRQSAVHAPWQMGHPCSSGRQ